MHKYGLLTNYIQLEDKDQNNGETLYIDEMAKKARNIVGFIKSTQPGSTVKQPNYIFEGRQGNHVFVCAIKSIVIGEEMIINYNLK